MKSAGETAKEKKWKHIGETKKKAVAAGNTQQAEGSEKKENRRQESVERWQRAGGNE